MRSPTHSQRMAAALALLARLGIGCPGPSQQCIDLGPECAAGFLLVLGKLGQRGRVAQAGQVGVGFPVLERLGDACRAWDGPLSRIFDHAARSALSQSMACFRQRALAASSSGGSSLPWPEPANAAAQAAL